MTQELSTDAVRETYTERQIEAASMVLEYAGIEPVIENVRKYLNLEVLSFTEDAHGHYCWYMDDDGNEICVNVETMEDIDTSEWE